MPSASTTRPFAASAAIESSLCERTMPGSVELAISMIPVRSMGAMSELDVDAAARGSRGSGRGGCRGAQGGAELLAGLEALVGILRQGLVEESNDCRRHV